MKRHAINLAVGILAAAAGSALLSLGVASTAGSLKHPFESLPWLWAVSALPSGCAIVIASLVPRRSRATRALFWVTAVAVAFGVVAVAGSLGAITVESLARGISRVNVGGYLGWCLVYATVLLPVTLPLAALSVRLAWRQSG